VVDIAGISGGPSEAQAAAITAVLTRLLEEEATARSQPPTPPRQSAWVLAWRPREMHAPLPSHTYDAQPWSELDLENARDEV
jgi:hypothetical protein